MKKSTAILLSGLLLFTAALFAQNPPGGYGPQQGGTPGGSNGQIQYNNSGAFGGVTGITMNGNGAQNAVVLQPVTNQNALFIQNQGSGGPLSICNSTCSQQLIVAADASLTSPVKTTSALYNTSTNCSSSASPAVCAAAASGSVVVAAAATTVQVNTSAVTTNSQVQLTFDSSLGTKLGVTCNTTIQQPTVSARSTGVSFTITLASGPVTNPACFSYTIIN